jgi:uncharacterized protein
VLLREELKKSMQDAMRAKEKIKLATLRLTLAAIKDRDIAARVEDQSEDDDNAIVQGILSKMIKQRRDSIVAYEEGGRAELAEREREEIDVIQAFLPRQLSDDETRNAVKSIVDELGAQSLKDMGRTMGALKDKYAGRMDFSKASIVVKEFLAG